MTSKEIVSVHVGGSGTKVGRDIWNLLNIEHDIDANGFKEKPAASPVHKFYHEQKGHFTPRALFIDCDEMDSIRQSSHFRHLGDSHFVQGNISLEKNSFFPPLKTLRHRFRFKFCTSSIYAWKRFID